MNEGERKRIESINERLVNILSRHAPCNGSFKTCIPGVHLTRHDGRGLIEHRIHHPVILLLAQGAKKTLIGSTEYLLRPNQALTIAIDMPMSSIIMEADPEHPLLGMFFDIDKKVLGDLLVEIGQARSQEAVPAGVSVADADEDFMEAMIRLASQMDKDREGIVRSRIILRELHYLLLTGAQRDILAGLYGNGACGSMIFAAIEFFKTHLDLPVRSSELAKEVHMSESSLYRYFKILTGLSPHQYHKQMRLHEARRLILAEDEQASIAAMKVGYESVTQFNREYKRLFGLPPHRSKKQG